MIIDDLLFVCSLIIVRLSLSLIICMFALGQISTTTMCFLLVVLYIYIYIHICSPFSTWLWRRTFTAYSVSAFPPSSFPIQLGSQMETKVLSYHRLLTHQIAWYVCIQISDIIWSPTKKHVVSGPFRRFTKIHSEVEWFSSFLRIFKANATTAAYPRCQWTRKTSSHLKGRIFVDDTMYQLETLWTSWFFRL